MGAGPIILSVWPWVCAHAGAEGVLVINPRRVSADIGISADEAAGAIEFFCKPDSESRSQNCEGRRLEHVEGITYRVVNHEAWRGKRNADERREYNRIKQREARERKRQRVSNSVNDESLTVSNVSPRQKTEDRGQIQKAEKSVTRKRATKPLPPEAIEISQYLYEAIRSHSPGFMADAKPAVIERKLTSWARDVDRGMRLDGMTPQGCRDAIDAAHRSADGFWRGNLLSGAKLRKHYEKLRIKNARPQSTQKQEGLSDDVRNFDFVGAGQRMDEFLKRARE